MYASSPLSNNPNTINICKAADFEISDDPFVSQGRCHVPLAESGNPEMYILYLLSSNQAATSPSIGTVVPQTSGPWSTVLNAASIPAYNQNNFPPPTGAGIFDAFSISTPGQYAVIAVLCTLNANNQYEIVTASAGSPVSDKIFINYLDINLPVSISGDQHLCQGPNAVYSIPASLAGFNPQWQVSGGTFTGSGASINVNWNFPTTSTGTVTVTLSIGEGNCQISRSLTTFQCCSVSHTSTLTIVNKKLSETILSGLPLVNQNNSGLTEIVVNGYFLIDQSVQIDSIPIFFGPYAKIILADSVEFKANAVAFRAMCGTMFDGIYASNPSQKVNLFNVCFIENAINGLVSEKGGKITSSKNVFSSNRVSITVRDFNPQYVPNFYGSNSPLEIYGNQFEALTPTLPPFQHISHNVAAIKVDNCGFVTIGVRNQLPNVFNPLLAIAFNMQAAIVMNNSGGNIVNNQFYRNNVVGSPSQTGAILATTSQHQAWIAPLQIGRLWNGGAAGDANHFDQGYQAIKTTNVRAVFIIDNTFKDYSSNIAVINASDYRVIQGNKINFQLGSPSNPNRSGSGIVVSSTHGLPTAGGAVWSNHVEACRQGIFLTTVNSMTISNNTIRTFSTAGASQLDARAGISASNGWNLIIRQNNLQHNTMAANSDLSGNNLRGISLNNVVDAFVWDNYVLRYGSGIYAANDNRVSQFRCNFLVGSIWGFNFNNVYLDQQGNHGDPTDNQWVSNRRLIRTNGTNDVNMTSKDWFFRAGFEFNPNNLAPSLFQIDPVLTTAGEVECSNFVTPGDTIPKDDKYEDPVIVEEVFGAVVNNAVQFSSASIQYFEESMTYRILDQNPNIIQQTNTSQQGFDDFYTTHHSGTKGDVKRLYDGLLGNTSDDINQLLSTFQPSNSFENKIAEVSAIYAQSWAKGRFELDSAERSVLLNIAQADASAWGEAVYTARVMLGMFDLDGNIGNGNQRRALNEVVFPEQELGKPYPNPTNGAFALVGNIETGQEHATIRMFDLQGRTVASSAVFYNDGAWQVADLNLPTGMYMYEFTIDAKMVQRGKVIIK